jgi:hypothetical protein
MALSLYPEVSYEDEFATMTQDLSWLQGSTTFAVMEQHPYSFYAGLRLVVMDGISFDVPNE